MSEIGTPGVPITSLDCFTIYKFFVLYIQSTSEIRTFGIRTVLKSERFVVRFQSVRATQTEQIYRSDFGHIVRISDRAKRLKSEQICSDFRHFLVPNTFYNRTDLLCPKSEQFGFRMFTVYIRDQTKRSKKLFGIWTFGFRHSTVHRLVTLT